MTYLWYQADVDVAEVLPLHLELELPEGLNKGHALNVPDCASQLLAQNTILDHKRAYTYIHTHTRWFLNTVNSTDIQNVITEPVTLSELVFIYAIRSCRQGKNFCKAPSNNKAVISASP